MTATFIVDPKQTSLGWRADVNGNIFTATSLPVLRRSIASYLHELLQKETTTPLDITCRGKEKTGCIFDVYPLTPDFYP